MGKKKKEWFDWLEAEKIKVMTKHGLENMANDYVDNPYLSWIFSEHNVPADLYDQKLWDRKIIAAVYAMDAEYRQIAKEKRARENRYRTRGRYLNDNDNSSTESDDDNDNPTEDASNYFAAPWEAMAHFNPQVYNVYLQLQTEAMHKRQKIEFLERRRMHRELEGNKFLEKELERRVAAINKGQEIWSLGEDTPWEPTWDVHPDDLSEAQWREDLVKGKLDNIKHDQMMTELENTVFTDDEETDSRPGTGASHIVEHVTLPNGRTTYRVVENPNILKRVEKEAEAYHKNAHEELERKKK